MLLQMTEVVFRVGSDVYCSLIYQKQLSDPNKSGRVLHLVAVAVACQLNEKFPGPDKRHLPWWPSLAMWFGGHSGGQPRVCFHSDSLSLSVSSSLLEKILLP